MYLSITESELKFGNQKLDDALNIEILPSKSLIKLIISHGNDFQVKHNCEVKIPKADIQSFYNDLDTEGRNVVTDEFKNFKSLIEGFRAGIISMVGVSCILEYGWGLPFEFKIPSPIISREKCEVLNHLLDLSIQYGSPIVVKLAVFTKNFIAIWESILPSVPLDIKTESKLYAQLSRITLDIIKNYGNTNQTVINSQKEELEQYITNITNTAITKIENIYKTINEQTIRDLNKTKRDFNEYRNQINQETKRDFNEYRNQINQETKREIEKIRESSLPKNNKNDVRKLVREIRPQNAIIDQSDFSSYTKNTESDPYDDSSTTFRRTSSKSILSKFI